MHSTVLLEPPQYCFFAYCTGAPVYFASIPMFLLQFLFHSYTMVKFIEIFSKTDSWFMSIRMPSVLYGITNH